MKASKLLCKAFPLALKMSSRYLQRRVENRPASQLEKKPRHPHSLAQPLKIIFHAEKLV